MPRASPTLAPWPTCAACSTSAATYAQRTHHWAISAAPQTLTPPRLWTTQAPPGADRQSMHEQIIDDLQAELFLRSVPPPALSASTPGVASVEALPGAGASSGSPDPWAAGARVFEDAFERLPAPQPTRTAPRLPGLAEAAEPAWMRRQAVALMTWARGLVLQRRSPSRFTDPATSGSRLPSLE